MGFSTEVLGPNLVLTLYVMGRGETFCIDLGK